MRIINTFIYHYPLNTAQPFYTPLYAPPPVLPPYPSAPPPVRTCFVHGLPPRTWNRPDVASAKPATRFFAPAQRTVTGGTNTVPTQNTPTIDTAPRRPEIVSPLKLAHAPLDSVQMVTREPEGCLPFRNVSGYKLTNSVPFRPNISDIENQTTDRTAHSKDQTEIKELLDLINGEGICKSIIIEGSLCFEAPNMMRPPAEPINVLAPAERAKILDNPSLKAKSQAACLPAKLQAKPNIFLKKRTQTNAAERYDQNADIDASRSPNGQSPEHADVELPRTLTPLSVLAESVIYEDAVDTTTSSKQSE